MKNRIAKVVLAGMMTLALAQAVPDTDGGPEPSPVPEPASMALMGAGLVAVAYAGWRRNRKS